MSTRNTIQKQLVLDAVAELKNHPTAEDVFEHIQNRNPGVGKATVYRNLKQLSDLGKLKRIEGMNQADHYDYQCHDHYHIQCTKCNSVYDIGVGYMDYLNEVATPEDFEINGHDIVFRGICPKCREK